MLKRDDLAKQFGLVVQQEIKNHQDRTNYVNAKIHDLDQKVDFLSSKIELHRAQIDNDSVMLEIRVKDLEDSLKKENSRLESHVNDYRLNNQRNSKEIQSIIQSIEKCIENQKEIYGKISELFGKDKISSEKFKGLAGVLDSELGCLKSKLERALQQTKEEILNRPSEAQEMRKNLELKIESNRIDFSGLLREMQVYKKNVFIIEKNIENIYTQIERLKR